MDISETYIKMCDCPEVRETMISIVRTYQDGNFYWDKVSKKIRIDVYREGKNIWVWLPRQDQIQEMLVLNITELTCGMHDWFCDQSGLEDKFSSMEQLWLAFYMYKKHEKEWTRGEWVKISGERDYQKIRERQ